MSDINNTPDERAKRSSLFNYSCSGGSPAGQEQQATQASVWPGRSAPATSGNTVFVCPFAGGQPPKKGWCRRHPVISIILLLAIVWAVGSTVSGMAKEAAPKVAIVRVDGIILESESVVNWIETIRKDDTVKSVVARINSPGGAVAPSQEIYFALERLAEEKPVIVSMSSMAASGGYYISLAGRRIYANPSTLTASIGVKIQLTNMSGLMETIGISETTLTTGVLKDAGSYSREMTEQERAYFQEIINDMYGDFVDIVAKKRKLDREEVLKIADGRAMTGNQALQARLVDAIGDYQEALKEAILLGNFEAGMEPEIVQGPEDENALLRSIVGSILDIRTSGGSSAGVQPLFIF